jgi:hypothetical protein
VDVDREAVDLAFEGAGFEQGLVGIEVHDLELFGDRSEIAHIAGLDEFFGVAAGVHLGRARRLAATDTADDDRVGAGARAGQRAVDPVIAGLLFEDAGKFGNGGGLALRRPPVRDLEIGGRRDRRRRQGGGDDARPQQFLRELRHMFLPICAPTVRSHRHESAQWAGYLSIIGKLALSGAGPLPSVAPLALVLVVPVPYGPLRPQLPPPAKRTLAMTTVIDYIFVY